MVNRIVISSIHPRDIIDLSVIIVNWNTRDLLRRCLCSVMAQVKDYRAEVVVVDNGSSDESVRMVKSEFSECRLVALMRNEGFAIGVNLGIRASRGSFLLLVNSDAVLLPGCVQRLYESLLKFPRSAMVGPRLLNPNGSVQFSVKSCPSLFTALLDYSLLDRLFPKSPLFGHYNKEYFDYTKTQEVDQLMAAVLMIRRVAIEEVGLLDPHLDLYFNDTDWCLRMYSAGWRIQYISNAEAVHLGGGTTSIANQDFALLSAGYRNIFYLFWKYYGPSSIHWLRIMIFWGFLGRMIGLILKRVLGIDAGDPRRWAFAKGSLVVALNPDGLLPRQSGEHPFEILYPKNTSVVQEVEKIRFTVPSKQLPNHAELALIVVNWNRKDLLHQCLSALAEACRGRPWEVIVIDNHSTDGSPEVVRHAFRWAKLVPLTKNLGFGRACNIGFQASTSEYVLFLNGDVVANHEAIRRLLNFIKQNPQIGIVGPTLVDSDSRLEPSWGKDPNLRNEFFQKWILRPKVRLVKYRDFRGHPRTVDWVSGAFFLARRAALIETGAFDQRFFLYFEDNDLCRRMRSNEWQVWFNPESKVVHQRGSSVKMVADVAAWEYRRSQLLYYWKHNGFLSLTTLRVYLIAKTLGRLLEALLFGFKRGLGYSQPLGALLLLKLAMKKSIWFIIREEDIPLEKYLRLTS